MIKSKLENQPRESLAPRDVDNAYRIPPNPAADNGRHVRGNRVDFLHLPASINNTQEQLPLEQEKQDEGMQPGLGPIPMIPINGPFQKTETI